MTPMLFLPLLFLRAQIGHVPPAPAGATTLAKVNGVPIAASDVEALLWDWRGSEVLEDLISYRLLLDAATKEKVQVTDAEVEQGVAKQLGEVKKQIPSTQTVEAAMRSQGFPQSRLFMRVRGDLILEKLAEKHFSASDFVKVSTLIFTPKSASADDLALALDRAKKAAARLAKGEKWETVLQETQSDPDLVGANGLLGWRKTSAFPEPAKTALSKGKAGAITAPVQTTGGIQIFRLEATGATADPQQIEELKSVYLPTVKQELLSKVMAQAKIERVWPGSKD